MLATISPSSVHIDETLSTLRYARQARMIVNSARVNEDPTARIIRGLNCLITCFTGALDGSIDEAGSGVWQLVLGKGYFWGQIWAWRCN